MYCTIKECALRTALLCTVLYRIVLDPQVKLHRAISCEELLYYMKQLRNFHLPLLYYSVIQYYLVMAFCLEPESRVWI